ncbi:hypothetical protein NE865_07977 [Phthorimaea operculella]|nr:hypothetical protein NE865_07977 [Phthorimaea operculella]
MCGVVQVRTRPIGVDSRLLMTNKAQSPMPSVYAQEDAQKTGILLYRAEDGVSTTSPEQYNNLLLEQYGFSPTEQPVLTRLNPLGPIEKGISANAAVTKDYSSQCVNFTNETATGTTGTAIDMAFNIGTAESGNVPLDISPEDVEISTTPRLKVMAEKFTRFKKDHIELRRLDERIICVEYDVYSKKDTTKTPIQVMRAYFCVKTNCKECQNNEIFKPMPYPMTDDKNTTELEKEVEMIEDLPENKPYLKDLRRLLKKRQAMSVKKNKSSLDLKCLYVMARNEMPPRDHDWSNTNLLSKAELQEVKNLILKKCDSRMHNLSRKKMRSPPTGSTKYSDSFYYDLFCEFEGNPKI